jgi:fermentation-respiration switch protein FrsA (DUF1100 family)
MTLTDISFVSGSDACAAWHFPAADDSLATDAGRPCVVMAHGLGGTKDSGLESFARALAAAGMDVLAFDYRGFGTSQGAPRQTVSVSRQADDFRAALAAAKRLPGVDPDRLVLWGVSLAGGLVLEVAAGRNDLAAVVALVPLVSGAAAGRLALKHHKPSQLLKSTGLGLRGKFSEATKGAPVMIPLVAKPGEIAAFSIDGGMEDYLAIAGPTWRNEIAASISLELGNFKPAKRITEIGCPLFVQIADFDRSAPPYAAVKAAFKGRAQVRHYPCDHFDVFDGMQWHEQVVKHQVAFLTKTLTP